jgi:hypothetical protein
VGGTKHRPFRARLAGWAPKPKRYEASDLLDISTRNLVLQPEPL